MPGRRGNDGDGVFLARVAGVPIGASAPLLALVILVAVPLALGVFLRSGALLAVPAGLFLFIVSFLVHEGAHATVARSHGLGVERITLRIGGGVTTYAGSTPGPGARIQIATAGPLASAVLASTCSALALALGEDGAARGFFELFAAVNLFLTAVNLLPAPRLDGGQIVAAIWDARRERVEARRSRVRSTGAT
jgi:Zn-dependent protease